MKNIRMKQMHKEQEKLPLIRIEIVTRKNVPLEDEVVELFEGHEIKTTYTSCYAIHAITREKKSILV